MTVHTSQIYATVGSEAKAEFLVTEHGIPRERIFNSRNVSFLDDVQRVTNGRRVDVVLNSLSGELLHASWQCVAKRGKMLEIGKRDMLERGRLALDVFMGNRSFYGFDLIGLLRDYLDILQEVTSKFKEFIAHGYMKPIQPIHHFSADNAADAVRFMRTGEHMGKIVVNIPEDPTAIKFTKLVQTTLFSDTSTYLLIGGLRTR